MPDSLQAYEERRRRLLNQLLEEFRKRFPASARTHKDAASRLVDGVSHALRMYDPFPVWVKGSHGAYLYDLDDHAILDFWQGHFANILGHNPPMITEALARALQDGHGLQCGVQDAWEYELAELLCRQIGAEKIRFTTSGTLATMYSIMLSRAYTGRDLVLKVGGGWHGAQPWGLKGVGFGQAGYQGNDTEGVTGSVLQEVLITSFNNVEALEDVFRRHGDGLACFIVEPWLGSGGEMAATPEFLRRARELTAQHGAVLILDEVIAGFRFHAGTLGALYGVQPDLTTMGKIIGGGMPVSAVAGRADIMKLCGREGGRRVRFEGGTYSGHPLSMLAGRVMIQYLVDHEQEVYPCLATMGERLRQMVQRAFDDEGVLVHCGGNPSSVMPGSSIATLDFPYRRDTSLCTAEAVNDPALCDVQLRERVVKLAFLLEDVFVAHGLGALSAAHTEQDLTKVAVAAGAVARRLKAAGLGEPH